MGWGSGVDIFDGVMNAIFDNIDDVNVIKEIAKKVIDVLRDGDWDTEGDSAYWDDNNIGPLLGNVVDK